MNDVAKWLRNAPYADGLHLAGADEIDRLQAERDAAVARYEYVRRMNVPQFQDLFLRGLKGERFDDIVDAAIDAARETQP